MEAEYCQHCGQRINARWESLSRGLVDTLVTFAQRVSSTGVNDVHLQHDLNLSKNAFANFQKLRYFGLVTKVKVAGTKQSGRWLLTRLGAKFLKGEMPIPKKVKVKNNKVVGYSDETITIADIHAIDAYWLKIKDYQQAERLF